MLTQKMMLLALLVNDVMFAFKLWRSRASFGEAVIIWRSQHLLPTANIVRRACYRRSPPAAGANDWSSAEIKGFLFPSVRKVLGGVGASFKKPPRSRPFSKAPPQKTRPHKNASPAPPQNASPTKKESLLEEALLGRFNEIILYRTICRRRHRGREGYSHAR